MKSLLYLTDLSEEADNAYAYALHIAHKQNNKINIVYVSPSFTPRSNADSIASHPLNNALKIDVKDDLESKINNLNCIAKEMKLDQVPIKFTVLNGNFVELINQFIQQLDISLLIMASSTPDLITKFLYGSYANKLLDSLHFPMLIVPDKVKFQNIEKIAVAVMFNQDEGQYINYALKLAKSLDIELKCVHVVDNAQNSSYSFTKINKWCKSVNIEPSQVEILHHNSVKIGISNYVSDNKIDIVCLFHRDLSTWERVFQWSSSKHILANSNVPLLICDNNK